MFLSNFRNMTLEICKIMTYDFRNRLSEFFKKPRNSARRESLLLNRMSYDLQLAAASSGYYVKVYISDVDDNGYDIIVDSEVTTQKLQVKSFLSTSKTSTWKIAKGLIKPNITDQPLVIDWTNIHPPGIGGGVVLQEVSLSESDISIVYYYTDIWLITLYARGIIGNTSTSNLALKFIIGLNSGNYHDKQSITKSLFLKLKSPAHLLSIMQMNSRYQTFNIRYLLKNRYNNKVAPKEIVDFLINKEIDKYSENKK